MSEAAMRTDVSTLWGSRTGGWLVSCVLHGGVVVLAMQAVMDIKPHLPQEPFHWDVVLKSPPAPSPANSKEVRPQEPVAPAVPHPPQPRKVQSAIQPLVRQVIERTPVVQTTQTVASASPMQRVVERSAPQERQMVMNEAQPVDRQPVRTEAVAQVQEAVQPDVREAEAVTEQQASAVQSREVVEQETTTVVEAQVSAVESPAIVQAHSAVVEQSAIQNPEPVEADSPSPVGSVPPLVHRAAVEHRAVRETPGTQADFGWLSASLWQRIEKLKRYPMLARSRRWEGKVVLEAVIRADGAILECQVAESSGHGVLDQDAMAVLRKASPLSLAHPLGQAQITILVPIAYRLDG